MIDWHSHVLPGIDDGSQDVAESISLISAQASQGITTVVATPHFYANYESVDTFLSRRKAALDLLRSELPDGSPEIRLGAEVRYYQGISRLEGLKELRIEGTKLLLLEMPRTAWTESMIRELIELSGKSGIQLVLAHVERYIDLQKRTTVKRINDAGILKQVNAEYFISFLSKRKAITALKEGDIQFVGSDCHNLTSRPPRIGQAYEMIRKKLGDDFITLVNEYGYSMLATIKVN